MTLPKPKLSASKVPSITALRELLDYGDAKLPRCIAFYDDIRVFRKKYLTSGGLSGTDLWDWNSRQHQTCLTEMSLDYLEKEGMGSVFWPDEDDSPYHNKLRYSRDHKIIKRVIKQLLFRLNQQQYRNNKYKNSKTKSALDKREENLSEAGSDDSNTAITHGPDPPQTPLGGRPLSASSACLNEGNPFSSYTATTSHLSSGTGPVGNLEKEIYTIPDSPQAPADSAFDLVALPRIPNKVSPAKRRVPTHTTTEPTQPKRHKPELSSSSRGGVNSPNPSRSSPVVPKRTSPRAAKPVHRPEMASKAQVDAGLASPIPVPGSPGPELDHLEDRDKNGNSSPDGSTIFISDSQDPTTLEDASHVDLDCRGEATLDSTTHQIDSIPRSSARDTVGGPGFQPTPSKPETFCESHPSSEAMKLPHSQVHQAPNPKRAVHFIYRLVLSRSPTYRSRSLDLSGRFQSMSLNDLISALDLEGNISGLIFTLQGPNGLSVEEQIHHDAEIQFQGIKILFNRHIRAFLASQLNTMRSFFLEIEIEPLRDDKSGMDDEKFAGGEWEILM